MSKVMIVDDDRTTVSLLQTLLELDGFEVVIVSMGKDVIPTAEADPPDIILMDYHLTDTEGVRVLRKIRQHESLSNMPVVMASGMDVTDEVMAAGANEFLVKPFEPSALPEIFNRLTGN